MVTSIEAITSAFSINGVTTVTDNTSIVDVPLAPIPAKLRTICISGFAESTRELANNVSADTEIWSLNRCYTFLKRWDRWFEVHQPDLYTGRTGLREPAYMELLRNSKAPIYMQVVDPSIPKAVQYPRKEILEAGFREYFTTSVAFMLALVAYEHRTLGLHVGQVLMYGIDMSAYSEYSYQRPCVEYWCGVLDGLGIAHNGHSLVEVPKLAPVLKGPSYGDHLYRSLWEQADARIAHLKGKQTQEAANLQAVIGAASEYRNVPDITEALTRLSPEDWQKWVTESAAKIKARRQELNQAHQQLGADLNSSLGALREAQHWLTIVGAPQNKAHEPEAPKLPNI